MADAAAAAADDVMVRVKASDDKIIEMPRKHAKMSVTLGNLLDDLEDADPNAPIPVMNVTSEILEKVKAYCAKHDDAPVKLTLEQETELREQPITGWDKDFVDVPLATLFHMILAANFLDIKPMLNLTCKAVAEMIKGKSPDEIKAIFGIEGEFTEEEKKAVFEEHEWLREDAEEAKAEGDAAGAKE
eukprot:m.429437 g.429437  ORF g.429437 m.429437 type:complete len:187 (+) comp17004_c0_seq1:236-796(+)